MNIIMMLDIITSIYINNDRVIHLFGTGAKLLITRKKEHNIQNLLNQSNIYEKPFTDEDELGSVFYISSLYIDKNFYDRLLSDTTGLFVLEQIRILFNDIRKIDNAISHDVIFDMDQKLLYLNHLNKRASTIAILIDIFLKKTIALA